MSAGSSSLFAESSSSRNRKITAREYKLLLDPERFSPLESSIHEWVRIVAGEACEGGMRLIIDGRPPLYRRSWYMDTIDCDMRRKFLSLCIHEDRVQDKPFRICLKGVHEDRYVAAMSGVSARGKSSNGFVEEISRRQSRYVRWSEIRRHKLPRIHYLDDVIRLFPATERYFSAQREQPVTIVDGVICSEVVRRIGYATFGDTSPVEFDLAASYFGTWRVGRRIDDELEKHMPDIVEFTFRYDSLPGKSGLERFPGRNVLMARRLLDVLSSRRTWVDASATSRFDDVYGRGEVG